MTTTAHQSPILTRLTNLEDPDGSIRAKSYIAGVLDGSIIVSKFVRLQVERHARELATTATSVDGTYNDFIFHEGRASRVIKFIEGYTRHSEGAWRGEPFVLDHWQVALVWILFGWVYKETKFRRFRFAWNELARGAGKSTLAAAIALYLLHYDYEGGAKIFSAATKKDQARLVHETATKMVQASPGLKKKIKVYRDNLSALESASRFVPLASDEDSLDGLNPHAIIADEVHAWTKRHLWDVLVTALGKRRQPLMFAITTAGFDRTSVAYKQHLYSEKVLTGVLQNDRWFAWIAALDDDDDPNDVSTWIKANPGWGVTVDPVEITTAYEKAKEDPGELNGFLRLRLNVWTNSSVGWMNMDAWYAIKEPVDAEALLGRPCFGGLDLSSSDDISAFVLVFPPYDGDTYWRVIPRLYIAKDTVELRSRKARVPYDGWADNGLLIVHNGNVVDYDALREDISQLSLKYDIREIGFDRWNAHQIVNQLGQEGFVMVPINQAAGGINAPTRAVMEKVLTGKLAHGNHDVLTWMASNAVADYKNDNTMRLDKKKSTEKIDGIAAMIDAFACAIVHPTLVKKKKKFVAEVW